MMLVVIKFDTTPKYGHLYGPHIFHIFIFYIYIYMGYFFIF